MIRIPDKCSQVAVDKALPRQDREMKLLSLA